MAETLIYTSLDFPELKETTVRRLKNLYKSNLPQAAPPKKSDTDDSDEDEDIKKKPMEVKELARKKTGRPLLIGEELDQQVQQYIKDSRKRGLAIYTSAGPEPRDFEWSGHPWTAMEVILLIDLM